MYQCSKNAVCQNILFSAYCENKTKSASQPFRDIWCTEDCSIKVKLMIIAKIKEPMSKKRTGDGPHVLQMIAPCKENAE